MTTFSLNWKKQNGSVKNKQIKTEQNKPMIQSGQVLVIPIVEVRFILC